MAASIFPVSSFEVLSQPLIPIPDPSIPYVEQAYFVQVSYPSEGGEETVTFDLIFEETTNFTQGVGQAGVMAQSVDAAGDLVMDPGFIAGPTGPFGFFNQQISPGKTQIYSVNVMRPQAPPSATAADAMPQSGTGWRGVASLTIHSTPGLLVATPTQRQIYFTSDLKTITDSVVYSIPTVSGETRF
jgi:hypothetical protein